MEPSTNRTTPLTRADDHLTQQAIDDAFSHFEHEISISLPPAVILDNLVSRVRRLYVTRIALLDEYRIDHPLGANPATAQRGNESQDNIRTDETRAAEQRLQQLQARDRECDQKIKQVALVLNLQHSAEISALRNKERGLREQITTLELKAAEVQRQHDGQMRDQRTLHMKEMYDFQRQAEVDRSAQAREIEALREYIREMQHQAGATQLGNTSHGQL